MPARYQTATATIPLSGTVTGDIAFLGAVAHVALHVPILDSCSLFIHASPDTTSANFVRVNKSDGTGAWGTNGTGSLAIVLTDVIGGFPYLRLQTSVAQTAARTFTLIYKVG